MSKINRHSDEYLNLSKAHRGVWLVKVPKYVDRWQKADSDSEAVCSFSVLNDSNEGEENIPRQDKLEVSTVTQQTLGVFSHVMSGSQDFLVPETGKVLIEGVITHKLVSTPHADSCYMKMKMDALRKANIPKRTTILLDRTVQTYKPVSNHRNNIEYIERKKAEVGKTRDDRDKVMDRLFGAFEMHQYYNIKDLVQITKQPITYLKEIMRDVCNYNLKHPHRNMWELKPEYRHYKLPEPATAIDYDYDNNN